MSKSTKQAAGGSDCASTYRKGRLRTLHNPVSFDMKEPERRNGCSTRNSFSVYKITSRVVPWPLLCMYIWHITDYGSKASSRAGELSFLIIALGVPAFQLHAGNCVELKDDQLCGSTPCHTAIHLGKVTYFSLSNTQSTWFQYNLYIKSN